MNKFITILALLISLNAFCQPDTLRIKSEISDVTVFFSGAQITRTGELAANKGKYLLIFNNLSQEINPRSIQVRGIENCKILSVKQQVQSNAGQKESPEVQGLRKEVKSEQLKLRKINNKLEVFDLEEKLLLDNSVFTKNDGGSSISEIKEAAEFYRLRLNEIRQEKLNLEIESEAIKREIKKIHIRINTLTAKAIKIQSEILVTVDCEASVKGDLEISYYVPSAGWEPEYDFRVDEVSEPLVIDYKANVFQSSGEDWKDVDLVLSTNNPSLGGFKPELASWYLDRRKYIQFPTGDNATALVQGIVMDVDTKEPIPFANVAVFRGGNLITGSTTDFDGRYSIKRLPAGVYNVRVSFVGYQTLQINNIILSQDQITFQDFQMDITTEALESVEVREYKVPLISKDKISYGATVTAE
nr:mucoidy inhibitor MuiA family protein [Bacteroidota bacterium]